MATNTEAKVSGSNSGDSLTDKKEPPTHIEQVHTNERVKGHPGYYEKDGLRTYGDDEDHDHEPPVSSITKTCNFLSSC